MEGWIKLHRKIKDHWIYQNPEYLKAWLTILFTVNYEDKKVLIQGELFICKRGQSLISMLGWSKLFGGKWTIQRIRTFFELLKNDEMITVEGLRKTTRITVCKYDDYQEMQQADNTQITSKEQGDNNEITTTKERRRINKKEEEYTPISPEGKMRELNISWKTNFDVYLSTLRSDYKKLILDKEWILQQEKYNPGVDILKSIEKCCVNYWATEAGWKKKKTTKTIDIDWKGTFANAISRPTNRIYKESFSKLRIEPSPKEQKYQAI